MQTSPRRSATDEVTTSAGASWVPLAGWRADGEMGPAPSCTVCWSRCRCEVVTGDKAPLGHSAPPPGPAPGPLFGPLTLQSPCRARLSPAPTVAGPHGDPGPGYLWLHPTPSVDPTTSFLLPRERHRTGPLQAFELCEVKTVDAEKMNGISLQ